LRRRLVEIVGERFVSDRPAERYIYSYDMTENPAREPAFVVMPATVEEVQQLVLLANQTKTPLVPMVAGQNVGGLTIPQVDNAIVVDLKRMDRIIEVDEEGMYAVVEPGVTFGHLKAYLDKHHPTLRYAYPLAPPFTSVMANALLQGLNSLSTLYGAMADFINGLEVVLPTGEVTRIGSCILGEHNWFSPHPLPDLLGLFVGWQGMTGIVTKIAVQLWPKMPYTGHAALLSFGEEPTTKMVKQIVRANVVEDGDCMSFTLLKMLMGVPPPVRQLEGEPEYATMLTFSGHSETELEEKYKVIEAIVDEAKWEDQRQLLIPWEAVTKLIGRDADSWVDFPSDAFKILCEYDGLTWMGTYIHPRHWGEALSRGRRIVEKYGFELMAFLKPMKGMHFGEFKFIIRFDKGIQGNVERVRRCNEELLDMALGLGAIPYKTPVWAARKVLERADPNWVRLARRIRETMDPNRIMNPGRWCL